MTLLSPPRFIYERLVADVTARIQEGSMGVGERLPSVREMSGRYRVSVSTVLQAYRHLEALRLVEARPRSGYYVLPERASRIPAPAVSTPGGTPVPVRTSEWNREVLGAVTDPEAVPLGAAMPDPTLLPMAALRRSMGSALRRDPSGGLAYGSPLGTADLRREIARREWNSGWLAEPDDILVTCGAEEALHLALGAVTGAGDIVAVESPSYFGVLQAIETLGRRALEIPTCPIEGMELDALEAALDSHSVAACVVTPNFHNPLGSLMPDGNKAHLVGLLATRGVPLIEDDTFGELHFEDVQPRSLRAWDRNDDVIRCGSFSKTLAPGYRVGWIAPGRRRTATVARLKMASTLATSRPPQLAIAHFLAAGGYDGHLRRLRRTLRDNVDRLRAEVACRFPEGTLLSRPRGGFVLWVRLPDSVDALELHRGARDAGISIAPGPLFSAGGGFLNFIRLSAGHPWCERTERAVDALAAMMR